MRILIAVVVILSLAGCQQRRHDDFENEIIMQIVLPQTTPVGPVNRKHKREDCPTGGWVGDGTVRTRCLDCDPPYADQDELQNEKEPLINPTLLPSIPMDQPEQIDDSQDARHQTQPVWRRRRFLLRRR